MERAAEDFLRNFPRVVASGRSQQAGDGKLHSHDTPELVLVVRGPYAVELGGKVIPGRTNSLFVLPGGVPHAVRAPGPWESTYVLFRQEVPILAEDPRVLDVRKDVKLRGWMKDLHDLNQAEPNVDRTVLGGLLFTILYRIGQLEQRQKDFSAHSPALERALFMLHRKFTEDSTAEAIADVAQISYSHLSLLFRKHVGCGPLQYRQKLRMEKARRLLVDPYLSIQEIASRCGYEDQNYFVRIFRTDHGVPPGRWRREQT